MNKVYQPLDRRFAADDYGDAAAIPFDVEQIVEGIATGEGFPSQYPLDQFLADCRAGRIHGATRFPYWNANAETER